MRSSGRERVMGLFGITKHKSHRSRIGENDGFCVVSVLVVLLIYVFLIFLENAGQIGMNALQ